MSGRRSKLGYLLAIGVIGIVAVILVVAFSPPGCEQTGDERKRPDYTPVVPTNPLDRCRMGWDSESYCDWPIAEPLALMSEQAYLGATETEAGFKKLGFEKTVSIVVDSMAAYVTSGGDVTVIVFRGTDDPADWLVNLNRSPTQTPHGEMHKGFADAYRTVQSSVVQEVRQRSPKHLWVTGHSLGGALAVVCTYDLIENEKLDLDGVVTFGQPMVARTKLADHLDKVLLGRFAHFVNDADIVPRVPPSYSHCGSLVWFTKNGIQRSKPKRPIVGAPGDEQPPAKKDELVPLSDEQFEQLKADLRAKDAASERPPDGRPIVKGNTPWIRDHSMGLYLDKIRSLLGKTGSM